MGRMNKQAAAILESSSRDIVLALQAAGESYTTICDATGMSRSQASLVATGKRELGERYFRQLAKMAVEKNIF